MGVPFFTVYDIETTGLSAACQCEIIEFAGIQLDSDLNEVGRLHIYIKPYKKLPKKIVELTGITNEQLAGCENRFTALPKIRNFIGNTISVCHNANFDVNFISTMCLQQGLPILLSYICTMKSFKAITGGKEAKLCVACEKFGIDLSNAHTAICDAAATVEVFKHLKRMDESNETSLMFKQDYNEKEHFISLMSNIARQNPNKKIRDTLCAKVEKLDNNEKPIPIETIFKLFSTGKTPLDIVNANGSDFYFISQLFMLWLNANRLPKFIRVEDFSLNKQVKTMIEHASTISELYDMHCSIYGTSDIDYGLYNYFWMKNRKYCDKDTIYKILYRMFCNHIDMKIVIRCCTTVKPNDIINAFCNFAFDNKDNHRDYIAQNLVSKRELENAVVANETHYSDDDITTDPNLFNIALTCELNERSFFKFKIA